MTTGKIAPTAYVWSTAAPPVNVAMAVGVGVVGVDTVVVLGLGPVLLLAGVVVFPEPQTVIVRFNDEDKLTEKSPAVVFLVLTMRSREAAAMALKEMLPVPVSGSVEADPMSLFAVESWSVKSKISSVMAVTVKSRSSPDIASYVNVSEPEEAETLPAVRRPGSKREFAPPAWSVSVRPCARTRLTKLA